MTVSSSSAQGVNTTATPVWTIDAGHSSASFSVKHMVVSTVKGRFGALEHDHAQSFPAADRLCDGDGRCDIDRHQRRAA